MVYGVQTLVVSVDQKRLEHYTNRVNVHVLFMTLEYEASARWLTWLPPVISPVRKRHMMTSTKEFGDV